MELRQARTKDLMAVELAELRVFLTEAFPRFDDGHWANALGGTHVLIEEANSIVAHASVVPRTLYFSSAGDAWKNTTIREVGYVESVAVESSLRGRGIGSRVLNTVNQVIRDFYDFGALATSSQPFYEQAGWKSWAGPTYVYKNGQVVRTVEGDQWLMVLASEGTDTRAAIASEWREGDIW